jgi:hypothetical protein
MEKEFDKDQSDNLIKNGDLIKLESMLNSLTEAVAAHKVYLEKHTAAMAKLTQVIKQLDQTLKKEIKVESRQSSIQLEELIKLFVEYDINPEFYHEYKMLQSPSATKHNQLVRRKPSPRFDK